SSRCPEHAPKREKKRKSNRSSTPLNVLRPVTGEVRAGEDRRGDENDERSKAVDVDAYRNGDDSPGPPGGPPSLVCGRIRWEQAGDADGIRDQDGVDQSSFMDLHRRQKVRRSRRELGCRGRTPGHVDKSGVHEGILGARHRDRRERLPRKGRSYASEWTRHHL